MGPSQHQRIKWSMNCLTFCEFSQPRFSILDMVFPCQVSIDAGNEVMQPLRGFVLALSMGMPSAQGKDDFKVLGMIVNPGSNNPVEVMDALKVVSDSKPASRGMLAGFRMIPSGKNC